MFIEYRQNENKDNISQVKLILGKMGRVYVTYVEAERKDLMKMLQHFS